MTKRNWKLWGEWHLQTTGFYSLHTRGYYWFNLETIRTQADIDMWVQQIQQKVGSWDVAGLQQAFCDIFGALSAPFSKQAIRQRIKMLLS